MNSLGKLIVIGMLTAAACGASRTATPELSPPAPAATTGTFDFVVPSS